MFQDTVDKKMVSTQNYSLLPYLPFAPVAAHIYLASSSNARVHYPHQQYEVRTVHAYVHTVFCLTRVLVVEATKVKSAKAVPENLVRHSTCIDS